MIPYAAPLGGLYNPPLRAEEAGELRRAILRPSTDVPNAGGQTSRRSEGSNVFEGVDVKIQLPIGDRGDGQMPAKGVLSAYNAQSTISATPADRGFLADLRPVLPGITLGVRTMPSNPLRA